MSATKKAYAVKAVVRPDLPGHIHFQPSQAAGTVMIAANAALQAA